MEPRLPGPKTMRAIPMQRGSRTSLVAGIGSDNAGAGGALLEVTTSARADGQAIQHCHLGVFEIRERQDALRCLLLARFRFGHRRRPPLPSPTASLTFVPAASRATYMGSQTFREWNQVERWLRSVDALRSAA